MGNNKDLIAEWDAAIASGVTPVVAEVGNAMRNALNRAAQALAAADDQIDTLQKECNHWCSVANERAVKIAAADARIAELVADVESAEDAYRYDRERNERY